MTFKSWGKGSRPRSNTRRKWLILMQNALIEEVKIRAIREGRFYADVIEDAVKLYLAQAESADVLRGGKPSKWDQ